jgi:hypothetical protein
MPEGFLGIVEGDGTDVWLPERQSNHPQLIRDRSQRSVLSFGRLAEAHPEVNRALEARVVSLGEHWRSGLREGDERPPALPGVAPGQRLPEPGRPRRAGGRPVGQPALGHA